MQQDNLERSRVLLDLLETVDRDRTQTQRSMAKQFGVALGLINAYLKISVRKGYVKVKRTPTHRYNYLLTPKGFAEKSRLTLLLLSNQLEQFRRARSDYRDVFDEAASRGWRRVALIGASDLAEISMICALEAGIEIAAVVDPSAQTERFVGAHLVTSLAKVPGAFDGAIITDVHEAHPKHAQAVAGLGADRVLAPALLGFPPDPADARK